MFNAIRCHPNFGYYNLKNSFAELFHVKEHKVYQTKFFTSSKYLNLFKNLSKLFTKISIILYYME